MRRKANSCVQVRSPLTNALEECETKGPMKPSGTTLQLSSMWAWRHISAPSQESVPNTKASEVKKGQDMSRFKHQLANRSENMVSLWFNLQIGPAPKRCLHHWLRNLTFKRCFAGFGRCQAGYFDSHKSIGRVEMSQGQISSLWTRDQSVAKHSRIGMPWLVH